MRKNTTISLILGIVVSAGALYLAFRHVPLKDLAGYLKSINYFWILPSVFVALMSFAFRVYRWQIILESAHKVSFWQAFHPLMIGFMINCILPGRVGEIARPAILKKNENVLFSTGLATVAAERAFDVGIMIAFSAVLLSTIEIDPKLDITFGKYHFNKDMLMAVGGVFNSPELFVFERGAMYRTTGFVCLTGGESSLAKTRGNADRIESGRAGSVDARARR